MTDQKPAITLAQWCAYLPYGLTVQSDYIRQGFTAKLVDYNGTNSLANGISIGSANYYQCKPLLRPMNKENEVSIDMLLRLHQGEDDNNFLFFHKGNLFSTPDDDSLYITYEYMPYKYIQVLLSNHYDIFNLIPQGLALPIE